MSNFMVVASLSFMLANCSLGAMLGDWLYIQRPVEAMYNGIDCIFYSGASYNIFGAICGTDMYKTEPYIEHIRILTAFSFSFSLMLYFMVLYRKLTPPYVKLMGFLICTMSLTSAILWQTVERRELPASE